jgi:hypothetical protein
MAEERKDQTLEILHSARRINELATKISAKRYLEIGVAGGRTFFAVDIETKIAVDPKFRFDWKSQERPNVRFHEMVSDEWFVRNSGEKAFDLIFLDGLHTFEQTFRDFCNSLSVAHNRTIWILDDTVPSDMYSAWPNQKESIAFRREAMKGRLKEGQRLSGRWHGDVFKVVFAIHDFFPTMSYCTIITGGNPQTIVWRHPTANFAPLFNNLETISRLSYLDLKKNFEILHPRTETEGLKEVLAATSV